MTNTTLYRLLAVAVIVTFWLCFYGLVCAQTAGDAEITATLLKSRPLVIGPMHFEKPAIMDGKQIIADADFKVLAEVALKDDYKIDSAAVTKKYGVVPVSSMNNKRGIIERIIDFLTE